MLEQPCYYTLKGASLGIITGQAKWPSEKGTSKEFKFTNRPRNYEHNFIYKIRLVYVKGLFKLEIN